MCLRYTFIFNHVFKRFSRAVAKIASLWLLSFFPPKTPAGVKNVATEACSRKKYVLKSSCFCGCFDSDNTLTSNILNTRNAAHVELMQ